MKVERTSAKDELAISGNDLEYVSRSAALINMVGPSSPVSIQPSPPPRVAQGWHFVSKTLSHSGWDLAGPGMGLPGTTQGVTLVFSSSQSVLRDQHWSSGAQCKAPRQQQQAALRSGSNVGDRGFLNDIFMGWGSMAFSSLSRLRQQSLRHDVTQSVTQSARSLFSLLA